MKGRRISALATASLMAMTSLAAMPQATMADEEKTVINIWSKDRHDADYVQKKIDEYNETNTDNIEVNYQLYTDNYAQAVDMAVQSGEMPDILVYQDQMFDKYLGEGQWADLYEFMDDDMKDYFKDVIYEGYNELDGKLYFIPTTGTTCRLFYNKEIFERVGIENPPETLEEMVEDAKLITSELSGEGIYGFAENMKSASSGLSRSMVVGLQRETGTQLGLDMILQRASTILLHGQMIWHCGLSFFLTSVHSQDASLLTLTRFALSLQQERLVCICLTAMRSQAYMQISSRWIPINGTVHRSRPQVEKKMENSISVQPAAMY